MSFRTVALSAEAPRTRSTHYRLHFHRPHDGRNRLMTAAAQIGHCAGCAPVSRCGCPGTRG